MLSEKQMEILAFPYTGYSALICDGCYGRDGRREDDFDSGFVRSGDTYDDGFVGGGQVYDDSLTGGEDVFSDSLPEREDGSGGSSDRSDRHDRSGGLKGNRYA